MGGAFLMGVGRYSEYRGIADPARAALFFIDLPFLHGLMEPQIIRVRLDAP